MQLALIIGQNKLMSHPPNANPVLVLPGNSIERRGKSSRAPTDFQLIRFFQAPPSNAGHRPVS